MSYSVLVIEDDPGVQLLMQNALTDNFETDLITRTDNLKEATEIVKNLSYDLVILDLTLVDSKGAETVSKLFKELQDPKSAILVVTADADVATKVDSILKGAQEYLYKPFTISEFVAAIYLALARKLVRPIYRPIEEGFNSIRKALEG